MLAYDSREFLRINEDAWRSLARAGQEFIMAFVSKDKVRSLTKRKILNQFVLLVYVARVQTQRLLPSNPFFPSVP